MSDIDRAAFSADALLELLIKHQPELVKPAHGETYEESGNNTGEFIAGLRARLIDMYNLRAHG